MEPSSRTPEGRRATCPLCLKEVQFEPTSPAGDAPCPHCGILLWIPVLTGEGLDFFVNNGQMFELNVADKNEAIRKLLELLSENGHLEPRYFDEILASIIEREEIGPTGIGRGFAIPHGKHDSVDQLVGIIGHISGGIEFQSLDGNPVTTIFLIISSPAIVRDHLAALQKISTCLQNLS